MNTPWHPPGILFLLSVAFALTVATALADDDLVGAGLAAKLEALRAARTARNASAGASLPSVASAPVVTGDQAVSGTVPGQTPAPVPGAVPPPAFPGEPAPGSLPGAVPGSAGAAGPLSGTISGTAPAAETDLADPDGILDGLAARPPADAVPWKPVATLGEGKDLVPADPAAAPSLFVGAGGEPFLLEPRQRRISRLDPVSGQRVVFARDDSPGLLDIADAAVLPGDRLVLADNRRQAVFLFQAFRHTATIGLLGERRLFRFIRHVFALPDGRFGVADSGGDRSFLFSPAGDLQAEVRGVVEPVWLNGRFVRLVAEDRQVRAVAVDPATGAEAPLFTYRPPAGQVPLDARLIGTAPAAGELAVLVDEGVGDADHPAWSRVLRFRAGRLQTASVLPDLSFDPAGRRSCALVGKGGPARLLAIRETGSGTGLFAADLP
ncbi:MAG: hypothetical protein GX442_16765 [Candidatus Riflebacteria bacterium]|nr:hypothetical protein [Candidatus Riflebacteria bacterium]